MRALGAAPGLEDTSALVSWLLRLVAKPSSPSPSSCIGAMLFTNAAISAIQVCARMHSSAIRN